MHLSCRRGSWVNCGAGHQRISLTLMLCRLDLRSSQNGVLSKTNERLLISTNIKAKEKKSLVATFGLRKEPHQKSGNGRSSNKEPFPRVVTCQLHLRRFTSAPEGSQTRLGQLLLSSSRPFNVARCLRLCLPTFEALRA